MRVGILVRNLDRPFVRLRLAALPGFRSDHAGTVGGDIDAPELQNKRLILGCFPWKFKGGEAAFARVVAFTGEWRA